jgi:predicted transcriptional regulator
MASPMVNIRKRKFISNLSNDKKILKILKNAKNATSTEELFKKTGIPIQVLNRQLKQLQIYHIITLKTVKRMRYWGLRDNNIKDIEMKKEC